MKNKVSLKQSQGKSGNFFISTDDNKFILKTITSEELELIRGILLKKFVKHLNRFPNSLICRIFGLFKLTLPNGNEVIVILMRNVIGKFRDFPSCKYDLKGSSINRKTEFEIEYINKVIMKDINFEEIEKSLFLDKINAERLRFATMNDAYFLNDMDIMDYSLFVVKVNLSQEKIEELFSNEEISNLNSDDKIFNNEREKEHYRKYLYKSTNENAVYIISIIDYLQYYNFNKYLETNFKFHIKSRPNNIEAISCVPPDIYCTRFIEYVKKITEVEINNNIN